MGLPRYTVIPCRRPRGLRLVITPRRGHPHGPLGLCGHTILGTHSLLAFVDDGNGPIEVVDTSALHEPRRDKQGIRTPGPFGAWFRISLHRCDTCKRAEELKRSIVCPCCYHTVGRGDNVSLVPTALIEHPVRESGLLPFSVTTEDGSHTVVCEACGADTFDDQDEPSDVWTGDSVVQFASVENIA